MKDKKVKVAIIGAGSAGLTAAEEVSKYTEDFLLINGGNHGTTCARNGCMPSKTFIETANEFYKRKYFKEMGINNSDKLELNTQQTMKHLRILRDTFVNGVMEYVNNLGDKYLKGYASFLEPNVLRVDNLKIIAEKVIIATGSRPIIPPLWENFKENVLSTDQFFEETYLPQTWGVVGAGVIGLELGQALSRLGLNVLMIEESSFIGGLSDPLVNKHAKKIIGEEFKLYTEIKADLKKEPNQKEISISYLNETRKVEKVLVSIGRKSNIKDLNLNVLGVKLDSKGLPSFNKETLQIENLPVFIAGDVNAFRPILHEAVFEGKIAGFNAIQNTPKVFKRIVPFGIAFTSPNIVFVGKRFSELDEESILIGEANFEAQGRAKIMHQNKGLLKIYADKKGKLLGVEMIAPAGEYIGQILAFAIEKEYSVYDMLNMTYYHPTVLEGIKAAFAMIAKKLK